MIEIDPNLKRELHAALISEGSTLKDWFIAHARMFLSERNQPLLPGMQNNLVYPQSLPGNLRRVADAPLATDDPTRPRDQSTNGADGADLP